MVRGSFKVHSGLEDCNKAEYEKSRFGLYTATKETNPCPVRIYFQRRISTIIWKGYLLKCLPVFNCAPVWGQSLFVYFSPNCTWKQWKQPGRGSGSEGPASLLRRRPSLFLLGGWGGGGGWVQRSVLMLHVMDLLCCNKFFKFFSLFWFLQMGNSRSCYLC